MGEDADQLPRDVAGQAGVAVERQAVAHLRQHGQVADLHDVAGVARAAQQPVELLELPALALPAHEAPFLRVPLALPVEEVEAGGLAVARVQRLDALARGRHDRRVARPLRLVRVHEVAEQREVEVRVEVADRLDLEVLDQLPRPRDAVEHGRDDHHGPRGGRHAAAQVEARQPPRLHQPGGDALHERRRQLGRRHQREQRGQREQARARSPRIRVQDRRRHAQEDEGREAAQVDRRRVPEAEAPHAPRQARADAQVALELGAAAADQEVAHVVPAVVVRGGEGGLPCAFHRGQRDPALALPVRVRQVLDRLAVAVAAQEVHAAVDAGGIALQDLLHQAHPLEQRGPVLGRGEAQAGDRVRDRDLLARLPLGLAADEILDRLVDRPQALVELPAQRRPPRRRIRGGAGRGGRRMGR